MLFTQLEGSQILEDKKKDQVYSYEKKILEYHDWLIKKGFSETYAKSNVGAVRGFFSYYRMPLTFRRSESKQLSEANRKT